MAKQNFLAGGFYGKLGQVVGQRWKNIRTIRTYVIPNNPDTPSQRVVRRKFAGAVVYAQVANMSNYKTNAFERDDMTMWNYRMSTATELVKLFNTFLNRIPLIPLDKNPKYEITELNVAQDPITKELTVTTNTELPNVKRTVALYATNNPDTTNKDDIFLYMCENTASTPNVFTTVTPVTLLINNNTHYRLVSVDDENFEETMILSSELLSTSPTKPQVDFDTSIKSVVVNGAKTTVTFNEPYVTNEGDFTLTNVHFIRNARYGDFSNPTITVINNGGFFAIEFTDADYSETNSIAFGNNCTITIGEINLETPDKILVSLTKTLNLKETTPINRESSATVDSVTNSGEEIIVVINTNNASNEWATSNITLNSITNGVVGNKNYVITNISESSDLTAGKIKIKLVPYRTAAQTQTTTGFITPYNESQNVPSLSFSFADINYKMSNLSINFSSLVFNFVVPITFQNNPTDGKLLAIRAPLQGFSDASYSIESKSITYSTNKTGTEDITANSGEVMPICGGSYLSVSVPQPSNPIPCQIECSVKLPLMSTIVRNVTYNFSFNDVVEFTNTQETYLLENSTVYTSLKVKDYFGVEPNEIQLGVFASLEISCLSKLVSSGALWNYPTTVIANTRAPNYQIRFVTAEEYSYINDDVYEVICSENENFSQGRTPVLNVDTSDDLIVYDPADAGGTDEFECYATIGDESKKGTIRLVEMNKNTKRVTYLMNPQNMYQVGGMEFHNVDALYLKNPASTITLEV